MLLIPAITLMALVQVVGIASVMPFLALVANPETIDTNFMLSWMYSTFGFESRHSFLVFVGVAALVILVLSNAFAALTDWMMMRFSWQLHHSLSLRMLEEYLNKPYAYFLNQNSAALGKNLLSEVKQVVRGFVVAAMQLVAKSFVAVFILALLVAVNPLLALLAFAVLGGVYLLVFAIVKKRLTRIGEGRSSNDRKRFQAANEALSGIKDIKLLGREKVFIREYARPSQRYSRYMASQQVIGIIPKYALEGIAFGGMILIVLYLLTAGEGLANILPLLGLYGFASYRLMPAMQEIFSALTSMRFSTTALDLIHRDMERERKIVQVDREAIEPLPFREELVLEDVTFGYVEGRPILRNFNLRIEPNTSVALVGSTGSGKTTSVDLILGLLEPQEGRLVVDGVEITPGNMASWQKNLGYVPQSIYLSDDTIANNIAFGVDPRRLDMAAVERAARLANIHEFIIDELPDGYDTVVGERGVRLSGGQRQRLGIARALYHDPAVLVLDEATSALDGVTEESIFKAVSEIGKMKTVIMIAHRLSTVRNCDVIYLLERGRIMAAGRYDELLANSAEFRAMAKLETPEAEASMYAQ